MFDLSFLETRSLTKQAEDYFFWQWNNTQIANEIIYLDELFQSRCCHLQVKEVKSKTHQGNLLAQTTHLQKSSCR